MESGREGGGRGGMWEGLLIRRTRTRTGGRHRPSELNGGL